ncbi:MAG: O-antigen ligase family protein [Candidatus Puniceispirillaceae bacterium]
MVRDYQDMRVSQLFHYFWQEMRDGLKALPAWERGFHIFWLLGPFILLIERSPADAWLSILAFSFVVRSVVKKEGWWLRFFWVRAGFAFWGVCLVSSILSDHPTYSLGEAAAWFRFPLFAFATAFWLARDRRLLYAMLVSTALGLIVMCGILTAEILIEGQKGGRLTWPYGDLVPGNYVAKVGLPVFSIMVALAVSVRGRIAAISGVIALVTMVISVMTGERINFLIRACGGMLAGLVWKPKWRRYLWLVAVEVLAVVVVFSAMPDMASRYTDQFVKGATQVEHSAHLQSLNGAWQFGKEFSAFGIGTGNYRLVSFEALKDVPNTEAQNHPHNYYLQMLVENGVVGLVVGVIFLGSIIWITFKYGLKNRDNVVAATAWVIPFGLFWPIATTGDFFGQWNNIFMWSAVALSLGFTGSAFEAEEAENRSE